MIRSQAHSHKILTSTGFTVRFCSRPFLFARGCVCTQSTEQKTLLFVVRTVRFFRLHCVNRVSVVRRPAQESAFRPFLDWPCWCSPARGGREGERSAARRGGRAAECIALVFRSIFELLGGSTHKVRNAPNEHRQGARRFVCARTI